MARLDVYAIPGKSSGWLLDVQADLLSELATRTVVPLLLESGPHPEIRDLNPVFQVRGANYVMVTQAIATVPVRELKISVVSLAAERDRVTRALDILLIGF